MREILEQVLTNAGYKIVRPEMLAPGLVAIRLAEITCMPLTFGRVRRLYTFLVLTRTNTPNETVQVAKELMNVLYANFEEVGSIRAQFEEELVVISVQLAEEV